MARQPMPSAAPRRLRGRGPEVPWPLSRERGMCRCSGRRRAAAVWPGPGPSPGGGGGRGTGRPPPETSRPAATWPRRPSPVHRPAGRPTPPPVVVRRSRHPGPGTLRSPRPGGPIHQRGEHAAAAERDEPGDPDPDARFPQRLGERSARHLLAGRQVPGPQVRVVGREQSPVIASECKFPPPDWDRGHRLSRGDLIYADGRCLTLFPRPGRDQTAIR